ncbi:MAG TPA: cupin domain-containing protein [Gaiellaceae bacterium]|nr:cupin domain-containing protein [Gaiellaceae bacterium]
MKKINLSELDFEYDGEDPEGYKAGMSRFGPSIGAAMLGATVYVLPPGQSICPYHYEYGNEEWAIVLEGRPILRHPGGEEAVGPLDVICFPNGPDGAHKFRNGTEETVRVMLLSTKNDPAIAVYPDSDKIGAWPGPEFREDHILVRRESNTHYYDGET